MTRHWEVRVKGDSGFHAVVEVEADSVSEAWEKVMAELRAEFAKAKIMPDLKRIEINELKP